MCKINSVSVKTQEKPDKKTKNALAKGTAAGLLVYGGSKAICSATVPKIANKMISINKGLTKDELSILNNTTDNVLKASGLDKKGVEIVKVCRENFDKVFAELKKSLKDSVKNKKLLSKIPDASFDAIAKNAVLTAKEGKNAFFQPSSNKILLDEAGKMGLAVFHETGHAMNKNMSAFGKMLQNVRGPVKLLALPIAMIAIFSKPVNKERGEMSKKEKAVDFVQKNGGAMAFLTCAPELLEEGMATLKGNKLAGELLKDNKQIIKKVKTSNALGFASYALAAVATAVGIKAAVKVKQKIVEKQLNKSEQSQSSAKNV